jgi:DNA methylase
MSAKTGRRYQHIIELHQTSPLLHPNQKPLGAISKLVCTYSRQDALILDPFCGRGATLVAARRSNRRAVGIEIEECFCELAALRLSQGEFAFANIPATTIAVNCRREVNGCTKREPPLDRGNLRACSVWLGSSE